MVCHCKVFAWPHWETMPREVASENDYKFRLFVHSCSQNIPVIVVSKLKMAVLDSVFVLYLVNSLVITPQDEHD